MTLLIERGKTKNRKLSLYKLKITLDYKFEIIPVVEDIRIFKGGIGHGI